MGSVWCKADKQPTKNFSPKIPFKSTTITKWTSQVCHVYKRPKEVPQPPRQSQKPSGRPIDRTSISHPQPMTKEDSQGWRSATLVVPDRTPVPPPRKKKKRKEPEKTSLSMNHLDRSADLDQSTISLPDRIESEGFSRSSSTFTVKPVLENDDYEVLRCDKGLEDKENGGNIGAHPVYYEITQNKYDVDKINYAPCVVDKLSDISEECAPSDDVSNNNKIDRDKTAQSNDGSDLNILQHIYNIKSVNKLPKNSENDSKHDSKSAWLQNILKNDEEEIRPDTLVNGERSAVPEGSKTPPTTPTRGIDYDTEVTHSVLLDILNRSGNNRNEIIDKRETIFQRNVKTNVIYKSSSTDRLADETFINTHSKLKTFPGAGKNEAGQSRSYHLTPPLYRRHTYHNDTSDHWAPLEVTGDKEDDRTLRTPHVVQYKDYIGSTNSYVSALRELDFVDLKPIEVTPDKLKDLSQKSTGLVIKPVSEDDVGSKLDDGPPSRRSSITDSLQEFEMSIYDMLKESKRLNDSSDEDDVKKSKLTG
uniref:Uncharacterized protein n=1 Tax=Clastoptera arizonana TaxID=38151 RepID=A0A1B6E0R7_9HEMI